MSQVLKKNTLPVQINIKNKITLREKYYFNVSKTLKNKQYVEKYKLYSIH